MDKLRLMRARGYIRAFGEKVEVHASLADMMDMIESALNAIHQTTGTTVFDLHKDLEDRVRVDLKEMGYDLDELRGKEENEDEEE